MQLVGIGKDPNDMGTSANLLVEALKHVGRLYVFAVGERQAEVGQGLFDVVLDPAGELGIFSAHLASQAARSRRTSERSRRSYIQRYVHLTSSQSCIAPRLASNE